MASENYSCFQFCQILVVRLQNFEYKLNERETGPLTAKTGSVSLVVDQKEWAPQFGMVCTPSSADAYTRQISQHCPGKLAYNRSLRVEVLL